MLLVWPSSGVFMSWLSHLNVTLIKKKKKKKKELRHRKAEEKKTLQKKQSSFKYSLIKS